MPYLLNLVKNARLRQSPYLYSELRAIWFPSYCHDVACCIRINTQLLYLAKKLWISHQQYRWKWMLTWLCVSEFIYKMCFKVNFQRDEFILKQKLVEKLAWGWAFWCLDDNCSHAWELLCSNETFVSTNISCHQ